MQMYVPTINFMLTTAQVQYLNDFTYEGGLPSVEVHEKNLLSFTLPFLYSGS